MTQYKKDGFDVSEMDFSFIDDWQPDPDWERRLYELLDELDTYYTIKKDTLDTFYTTKKERDNEILSEHSKHL